MKVKTYLINLKDSTERRERAMEEISRYPFMDIEWVEAVNGKKLTEEETARLFNRKNFVPDTIVSRYPEKSVVH